jgi:hypothetical protein
MVKITYDEENQFSNGENKEINNAFDDLSSRTVSKGGPM